MWGVEPASPIKRRKLAGTDIYDGTRFLKVRFTDVITSLPYSTKFDTLEGAEYFRVIHDSQQKVCRLCLQPGHIIRECPEFRCFQCSGVGHYARECTAKTETCKDCKNNACTCNADDIADMSGQEETAEHTGLAGVEEEGEKEEEEENDDDEDEDEEEEERGGQANQVEEGEKTGVENEQGSVEKCSAAEKISGAPTILQRPGRLSEGTATPLLQMHEGDSRRDKSRSCQRTERAGSRMGPLDGQTFLRAGESSGSDLEGMKKRRSREERLSRKGMRRGKKGT